MATLQLVIHCLCLYVRDEQNRIVHVLMPATKGHHAQHFAHLEHPSFQRPRSLEGWALMLGTAGAGTAALETLAPQGKREILDLTVATAGAEHPMGKRVKRALVNGPNPAVTSRITLRAGEVTHTIGETFWKFKGRMVEMVTRVSWEMEIADPTDRLEWHSIGASGNPPLDSLSSLGSEQGLHNVPNRPDGRMGYTVNVFHSTLTDLKPEEVSHHFRAFYEQLLDHEPTDDQLPRNRQEGPRVHCGSGQAVLEHGAG